VTEMCRFGLFLTRTLGYRYWVTPVGVVRSSLKDLRDAPMQGVEGAPDAWLEISLDVIEALHGFAVGDEIVLLTWLDRARRDVLKVHPRDNERRPLTGVFATRSADRPNPIGLHRVTILEIVDRRLKVGPLEAIDGTPIVDIKPVLAEVGDA
jgi:tRNA-Thr(GGU) m(6)t(6)A37 methyltransferase TsaA